MFPGGPETPAIQDTTTRQGVVRAIVVLALVAVCGGMLVGGVAATEDTAGSVSNGTLTGEVTDAATGDPVENASVLVANTESASVTVTTTDATGTYERSLEPGAYAVGVLDEGYEPAIDPAVSVLPNETTEHDIELSPVEGDPAVAVVDDPEAGAETDHLWGTTVTGEQNRTLEEIELDYSGTGADLDDVGELDLFVTVNGELVEPVIVNNVDSETVEVDLDPPLFEPPAVSPGDIVAVAMVNEEVENPTTPDKYEPTIELRGDGDGFTSGSAPIEVVDETGTLTGVVTDNRTGAAVEEAVVVAVNGSDGDLGAAVTDDAGSYDATLVPNEYNVTVGHPEYELATVPGVTVTGNETTLDVSLRPATETFVVPAVETSAPVEAGERLIVEPTVLNAGQVGGTQTVELLVDGTPVDSAEVSLEPGETWAEPLRYETNGDDQPGVTVTVATANDSAERSAQVHEPVPDDAVGDVNGDGNVTIVDAVLIQQHLAGMDPEPFDEDLADVTREGGIDIVDAVFIQQDLAGLRAPGNATVTALDAPPEVPAGGSLNVSTSINNTGGMGTIQAAEVRIAETEAGLTGNATEAVEVVDLAPDDSTDRTVSVPTDGLLPGEYVLGVVTDDTTETTPIEVTPPDTDGTALAATGSPTTVRPAGTAQTPV